MEELALPGVLSQYTSQRICKWNVGSHAGQYCIQNGLFEELAVSILVLLAVVWWALMRVHMRIIIALGVCIV